MKDSDYEYGWADVEGDILLSQESEECAISKADAMRVESDEESLGSVHSIHDQLPWWGHKIRQYSSIFGASITKKARPIQVLSGCTAAFAEGQALKAGFWAFDISTSVFIGLHWTLDKFQF